MAAFVALKPCRFGSVGYGQGDIIPDGAVLPKRVLALARMGVIAPVPADSVHNDQHQEIIPTPDLTKEPENGQESLQNEEPAPAPGKKAASKK